MPWPTKKTRVIVTPVFKTNLNKKKPYVFKYKEEDRVTDYAYADEVEAELSRKDFIASLDKKAYIVVGALINSKYQIRGE